VRVKTRHITPTLRSELNVTPLVDVVLVLLIIFMVVTPMMRKGKGVELPAARSGAAARPKPAPTLVTVTQDHTLQLDGREVTVEVLSSELAALVARNPEVEVTVQGDRRLKVKDVKDVLKAATGAGVRRLNVGSRPHQGS